MTNLQRWILNNQGIQSSQGSEGSEGSEGSQNISGNRNQNNAKTRRTITHKMMTHNKQVSHSKPWKTRRNIQRGLERKSSPLRPVNKRPKGNNLPENYGY